MSEWFMYLFISLSQMTVFHRCLFLNYPCNIQYFGRVLTSSLNLLYKWEKESDNFLECLWSVVFNEAGNFKHNSSVINTVSLTDLNMIVCFLFPKSTLEVSSDFSRHFLVSVGFNMWTLSRATEDWRNCQI